MDTRNLIGQAQGILMARYGLTAPKAFRRPPPIFPAPQHQAHVLAEQLATTGQLPDLDSLYLSDQGWSNPPSVGQPAISTDRRSVQLGPSQPRRGSTFNRVSTVVD